MYQSVQWGGYPCEYQSQIIISILTIVYEVFTLLLSVVCNRITKFKTVMNIIVYFRLTVQLIVTFAIGYLRIVSI